MHDKTGHFSSAGVLSKTTSTSRVSLVLTAGLAGITTSEGVALEVRQPTFCKVAVTSGNYALLGALVE